MKKHRPTSWLWWLALSALLVGGGLAYMFSLRLPDPFARSYLGYTLASTIGIVGVCLIIATSNWWIKK